MSALWSFGSVGIYVSDEDIAREIKRAELFKLDATSSTWHYFGAGSRKYHIKGLVIGETDRAQLESDGANNITRTFTTPWASYASYFINGTPKFTARRYGGATIDGVTYNPAVTPLYDCDIEITA